MHRILGDRVLDNFGEVYAVIFEAPITDNDVEGGVSIEVGRSGLDGGDAELGRVTHRVAPGVESLQPRA